MKPARFPRLCPACDFARHGMHEPGCAWLRARHPRRDFSRIAYPPVSAGEEREAESAPRPQAAAQLALPLGGTA